MSGTDHPLDWHTTGPDPVEIEFRSDPQVIRGDDGVLYELVVTGTAEITRGPLGRFIDLADQIEAEGLKVPPEILDLLHDLQQPKE